MHFKYAIGWRLRAGVVEKYEHYFISASPHAYLGFTGLMPDDASPSSLGLLMMLIARKSLMHWHAMSLNTRSKMGVSMPFHF